MSQEPSMVLGYSKGTLISNPQVYVITCHDTRATQPGCHNAESNMTRWPRLQDYSMNHEHRYIWGMQRMRDTNNNSHTGTSY